MLLGYPSVYALSIIHNKIVFFICLKSHENSCMLNRLRDGCLVQRDRQKCELNFAHVPHSFGWHLLDGEECSPQGAGAAGDDLVPHAAASRLATEGVANWCLLRRRVGLHKSNSELEVGVATVAGPASHRD